MEERQIFSLRGKMFKKFRTNVYGKRAAAFIFLSILPQLSFQESRLQSRGKLEIFLRRAIMQTVRS